MSHTELLAHFRSRKSPKFFAGFADFANTARLQSELFPKETKRLLAAADRITRDHCWPLLGFGEKCFGAPEINWNRDPLSGADWPLDYHADINLFRGDGSDARVLWEVNRMSHLITLGRAYAVSHDDEFATEFLKQVRSWRQQNPVGLGANWSCAMEVALRAMNLLAAFYLFLPSSQIDEDALAELLMMFDQHGAHIRRNLEYSHIATSNHYLCDVTGLLWLGIMLPELEDAQVWREFGLRELLNEIDKQIFPDGADSESSTGYHRLKLELLLYSFVLCRENGIEIEQRYWRTLHGMAGYTRVYLRPDGYAPLIGDSDSGQILPIVKRAGDDHAYVLDVAAAVCDEPKFKLKSQASEEVLWMLGAQGLRSFESLPEASPAQSQTFPDAGIYILRQDDMYLLFNASGCGLNGRGSHGHNDALSIEVSACGTAFIVDPGSYVYTHDLRERHLFRSTEFHSTAQIDRVQQNATNEQTPFVIGDEAHPRVLKWETNAEFDYVAAEHDGYQRLDQPVTHRRSIRFDKQNRFWLIEDEFAGLGKHPFSIRFHFDSGLDVALHKQRGVIARDKQTGARLSIQAMDLAQPAIENQFVSRDYGSRHPSSTTVWGLREAVPLKVRWLLIPLNPRELGDERLALIEKLVT